MPRRPLDILNFAVAVLQLALCGVGSHLLEVFQVVKLTERVSLYGDECQAAKALCAAG